MPPGNTGLTSFQGTIAELLVSIGLDANNLNRGLYDTEVNVRLSAQRIGEIWAALERGGPRAGADLVSRFSQMGATVDAGRARLLALRDSLQQTTTSAVQASQALKTVTGGGGTFGPGSTGFLGGDEKGGSGTPLVARLTERFLIYQGLRLAVRGVTDALQEADNITRRMDQTGWGSRGVQTLMRAAQQLNAPIDQAASAITRLNEKIEEGSLPTISILDRLGLKWTDLQQKFAQDPQAAAELVFQRLRNDADLTSDAFGLLGDRSGKMLAFIKEWDSLKSNAAKDPMLSDENRADIQLVNRTLERLENLGEVGLGKALGFVLRMPLPDTGASNAVGLAMRANRAAFTPFGPPLLSTDQASGGSGAGAKDPAALSDVRRLLDEYRRPNEMAVQKMMEDVANMQKLERAGVATHAQSVQFMQSVSQKWMDEQQAQLDAMIRSDTALLNEFGVQGKHASEVMTEDFSKLIRAFREGRVALEDMKEATANYYALLEDQASRPGLTEAIKMFEQGAISGDELNRARARANALKGRSAAEEAFASGAGAFDFRLLGGAQTRYLQNLRSNAPERYSVPEFLMGPNGSSSGSIMTRSPVPGSYQGPINVIPMDQFSEQLLRRWKQQGLSTP